MERREGGRKGERGGGMRVGWSGEAVEGRSGIIVEQARL